MDTMQKVEQDNLKNLARRQKRWRWYTVWYSWVGYHISFHPSRSCLGL